MLKAPDIPSILVETAFICNPDEELKLRDRQHQARFAESIADGHPALLRAEPAARARADRPSARPPVSATAAARGLR